MKKTNSAACGKFQILALVVFALGLIGAMPLRCYQLLHMLNNTTGFYLTTNFTIPLLNGIVAGVLVLAVLISYLGRNTITRPIGRNIPLAVVTYLFAFSLIADGINKLFEASFNGFKLHDGFILAQGGFALLSSVFFIIVGISFTAGTDTFIRRGLLAVSPVFWAISRILQRFSVAIDFKNVSELLYELSMLCLAMLFFLAFARVYVNTEGAKMSWRIFAFGVPAALFAFLCSLPRYFVKFIGMPERLVQNSPPEIADLCMAIFITAVLIAFLSGRQDPTLLADNAPQAETEEAEKTTPENEDVAEFAKEPAEKPAEEENIEDFSKPKDPQE